MKNRSTKLLFVAIFMIAIFAFSAISASAAEVSYDETVVYDGTATFEKVVEDALTSGKNTIIELKADVTYSANSKTFFNIGEQYAKNVPTNTIKITSGTNVDASGNPYGFVFNSNTILNMYGNYVLDDIKLNLNANWTTGGCLQVPAGSLQIGHPNTAAAGQPADWGNVYMPSQASIMGPNLSIYTGGEGAKTYRCVGAVFYGSNLTVGAPNIYFGGEAKADILIGGMQEYQSTAPSVVTGKATLKLMDSASADWMGVTRGNVKFNDYGADVTINTTGTLGDFELIGRSGGRYNTTNYSNVALGDQIVYKLTIDNVNTKSTGCFSMGRLNDGNPRINFVVDINGGTFNGVVYLGYHMYNGMTNAYNAIGKMTATINNATFKNAFYCGSRLGDNTNTKYQSNEQFQRTITIEDCTFQAVDGVTNSGIIFGGSHITDDGVTIGNAQGTTWFTDITIKGNTSCAGIYGGSHIVSKNADFTPLHNTRTKITVENVNMAGKYLYGGSLIEVANANHKAPIEVEIKGGSFGRVFGGSYLKNAGDLHEGTTTVKINGNATITGYLYGGSLIANATATQTGASRVEILDVDTLVGLDTFAGCWADTQNAVVACDSTLYIGSQGNLSGWTGVRYAGSFLNNGSQKATGDNTLIIEAGSNMGTGKTYAGSRLSDRTNGTRTVGAADKPIKITTTINCASNDVTLNGEIYGGCLINDGATNSTVYADIEFNLKKGKLGANNSAGCFYEPLKVEGVAQVYPDAKADDGITGGFAHVGTLTFNVEGGILNANTFLTGRTVNIDGDVFINISGGTFNKMLMTVGRAGNYEDSSSVSGDVVTKISGGTFNDYIALGGNRKADATFKTDGYNVIGGNSYTEFIQDNVGEPITFKAGSVKIRPAGTSVVKGKVYLKFVGDIPTKNANNEVLFDFQIGGSVDAASYATLDLAQWTSTTTEPYMANFDTIIKPFAGKTVTISGFDPATAEVEDLADITEATFTWSDKSYTYAKLTEFDEYATNKNAVAIIDAETGKTLAKGLGIYTEAIKVKIGSAESAVIAITSNSIATEKDATITEIKVSYGLVGSSIRLQNLAMRCRAKIHKNYFDGIESANDMGGYKVYKMGILVGKDAGEAYEIGDANVSDAVAFENGQFKAYESWATGEDADYYYFAAAITGYEDATTFATRANTTICFRAYIILEDANGIQEIIYIDNPVENAGATNYAKSLVRAAEDARATAWYEGLTPDNKKKVDDIVAAKA